MIVSFNRVVEIKERKISRIETLMGDYKCFLSYPIWVYPKNRKETVFCVTI